MILAVRGTNDVVCRILYDLREGSRCVGVARDMRRPLSIVRTSLLDNGDINY